MRVLHIVGAAKGFEVERAVDVYGSADQQVVLLNGAPRVPSKVAPAGILPERRSGAPSPARYRAIGERLAPYDLVFSYGYEAVDALLARRIFRGALPPIVHHETVADNDPGTRSRIERQLVRRLALPGAARVIVGDAAINAQARTHWRVSAERLSLMPPGIILPDLAAAPPTLQGFVRKRGDFVVGASPDDLALSQILLLLRAVAAVPNARLVLTAPMLAREAKAEVARLGLVHRLSVCTVSTSTALRVLDVWVALNDASALPPMAAALPIIFVDEADFAAELLRLAGNGDRRRELGQVNRARVERDHDERALRAQLSRLSAVAVAMRG